MGVSRTPRRRGDELIVASVIQHKLVARRAQNDLPLLRRRRARRKHASDEALLHRLTSLQKATYATTPSPVRAQTAQHRSRQVLLSSYCLSRRLLPVLSAAPDRVVVLRRLHSSRCCCPLHRRQSSVLPDDDARRRHAPVSFGVDVEVAAAPPMSCVRHHQTPLSPLVQRQRTGRSIIAGPAYSGKMALKCLSCLE